MYSSARPGFSPWVADSPPGHGYDTAVAARDLPGSRIHSDHHRCYRCAPRLLPSGGGSPRVGRPLNSKIHMYKNVRAGLDSLLTPRPRLQTVQAPRAATAGAHVDLGSLDVSAEISLMSFPSSLCGASYPCTWRLPTSNGSPSPARWARSRCLWHFLQTGSVAAKTARSARFASDSLGPGCSRGRLLGVHFLGPRCGSRRKWWKVSSAGVATGSPHAWQPSLDSSCFTRATSAPSAGHFMRQLRARPHRHGQKATPNAKRRCQTPNGDAKRQTEMPSARGQTSNAKRRCQTPDARRQTPSGWLPVCSGGANVRRRRTFAQTPRTFAARPNVGQKCTNVRPQTVDSANIQQTISKAGIAERLRRQT